MKITDKDYTTLKDAINKIDRDAILKHKNAVKESGKFKDFDKRIRWDLLHATKLIIGDGAGATGDIELYAYMDDTHIDTALKTIVKELGL